MKPRHWLFLFLGVLTVLRFALAASYELSPDECYYYMWSQHPALSYYSKGPGVAMAILASTKLFGASSFGVRFFSPLLALGTSLIVFFFARRVYNERVGIWSVLLLNTIPIFNVGSIVMTIDPLSIFLWAASVYTFWLALEKSPAFTWWWPFTGLLIGLGFLAKYTNAMELLSIILLLGLTRRYRRDLLGAGFWSMLVMALGCTVPVFVWNESHAWITLVHLSERGDLNTGFALHPMAFLQFLGGHCTVYSPLIFIGLLEPLVGGAAGAGAIQAALPGRLCRAAAGDVRGAGVEKPRGTELDGAGVHHAGDCRHGALAGTVRGKRVRPAVCRLLAAVGAGDDGLHAQYGHPARGGDFVSVCIGSQQPASRLAHGRGGGAEISGRIRAADRQAGVSDRQLIPDGVDAFGLHERSPGRSPGHPPVYIPESQNIENEFSFWPRYDEFEAPTPGAAPQDPYYTEEGVNLFEGRNALFVTDEARTGSERPPSAIERGFDHYELVRLFRIVRRGQPLRELRVFACYNYKPLSL